MLSHAMGPWIMIDGVHAFSADGKTWCCTPTPPYNGTVHYTDGGSMAFANRQRPKVLLDPTTGELAVLFTAVIEQNSHLDDSHLDDHSYTLAVPIRQSLPR